MNIEEWWGRMVEKRGTYDLTNMPDKSPTTLQKLSTEDVAELYRSEGSHPNKSVGGILAGAELRRRENWTARAAIVLSLFAIVVAALHR